MKILHEEISDCFQCPYFVDWNAHDCSEHRNEYARDFHCGKHRGNHGEHDFPEIDNSQIKREWRTGKFNNIIHLEIEIPEWCPLPNKETTNG